MSTPVEETAREPATHSRPLRERFREIFIAYSPLGFISFGGPGVHVVLLREIFVDKRKWVDTKTFTDLFALGNALPGPGSTQLAFSIAVVKHGVLAGLFAFLLWSLPGAIGMAALAIGISRIPDNLPPIVLALFTGLNAAAVGLIALAAVQLGTASITDRPTLVILWLSASFGICYHAPWMYPTLIASGGIVTLLWDQKWRVERRLRTLQRSRVARNDSQGAELVQMDGDRNASSTSQASRGDRGPQGEEPLPVGATIPQGGVPTGAEASIRQRLSTTATANTNASPEVSHDTEPATPLNVVSYKVAAALIFGFLLLLVIPISTRAGLSNAGKAVPRLLDFFSNMLIAGTIIFGGGPVVIPLLRDYVVVEGWVSSRDFLLIFAVLQAFPGPNFNFAVALGFLAVPSLRPIGAILGYIGIFAPGILLKLGLLPFYSSWRENVYARSVLRGINAAASGLVFTAVWQLFLVGYIYQPATGDAPAQTISGPLTADPFWAVVASGSFLSSRSFKAPPWLSIAGGGVAGLAWYGVQSSKG